ncbi:MAG: hypothetical protein FWG28_08105 [Clostridiales bacterium]|nr:hypothetical protein [Clostridiales bacterium]
MIRLNEVEYEYRPGLSLGDIVGDYNLSHAKVDFDACVVIIDSAVVPAAEARIRRLSDGESVYIVPKLDGG